MVFYSKKTNYSFLFSRGLFPILFASVLFFQGSCGSESVLSLPTKRLQTEYSDVWMDTNEDVAEQETSPQTSLVEIIGRIKSIISNSTKEGEHNSSVLQDVQIHRVPNAIQRLSQKLLPYVTKAIKGAVGEWPDKDVLKTGLDKILFTFWEPVLMLNKMAYIAWLPAVAGVLSVVSNNSIIAGVVFLMIIASAFQKKALLAEAAAGAISRTTDVQLQPKRIPRSGTTHYLIPFEPELPKSVNRM